MRFFFDENLPPTLPEALHILHKSDPRNSAEIHFIPDFVYRGAPDEEWIPAIKEDGAATVITCDYQLHKRKDQRLLYQKNKLGLVVIRPLSKKKGLPYWDKVKKIIEFWDLILKTEKENTKPYLLLIKMSGGKPDLVYNGKNWRDLG
jgi:hypothetical protein